MRDAELIGNILTALLWVGMYGSLTALFLYTIWRSRRRRSRLKAGADLEAIAREVKGEVDRRNHQFPFVRFQRGEIRCFFIQWGIGSADVIISTLEACIGVDGFLEATSRDSRRVLSRFPRAFEIPVEGEARIVTADRPWAERFLKSGLAELLAEFRHWSAAPIRVQMTPGRLTVEVEALLKPEESVRLTRFIDRLLEMVRQPVSRVGVTVLSTSFDPSRGRCPACGLGTKVPITLCGSCRAPHHPDCWTYLGRCGIFGCGGARTG